MRIAGILRTAAFTVCVLQVKGQSPTQSIYPAIDSMYSQFAREHHIPGLAYGIVANGKLVHTGNFGVNDIRTGKPVTSGSVFRIASMTKSFTAMAILALRDEGKLRLDDPVSQYIPEMLKVKPLTGDSPPITIRQLLSHSAGFPEDNPWGDRQLQRTDKELMDFIAGGVSLSNAPGLEFEYSNLGFGLLGHIVTKASGKPFEQYIREKIFIPLGMNHTYWEYTEAPASLLAHGYRWINGGWKEEPMLHSGAYGAMGGMLTTIDDFSKYIAFHLSAWPSRDGEDKGPIKRSSVREMHQAGKISGMYAQARNSSGEPCPSVSAYNFGLSWSKDCEGEERVRHSGGLPGFGTNWTMMPKYGVGVVSFCSLTYEAASRLDGQAMDLLINTPAMKPYSVTASAILEQRQKELMGFLPEWNNATSSKVFSENFFDDYPVDSLRKEARLLLGKIGKIQHVEPIRPENQLRGTFEVKGEKGSLEVWFSLSPENPARIQAYHIQEKIVTVTAFEKYGLKTVGLGEYRRMVQQDPRQELVALNKFIPGIRLDIRYATDDNIMHQPMYNVPAAFLRRPAAEGLRAVQEELKKMGYGLKIYDGYRPYQVTVAFYEAYHDTAYVASPYTGSRHNRGCAVDLTLIDLKTGAELEMPTGYDAFTKEAAAKFAGVSAAAGRNRALLQELMLKHGFLIYPDEWWHFDFAGYREYPVMDIPYEKLF